MDRYKNECEKEGFQPEVFCRKFKEQCGKLDTIDADTTDDFGDDSLYVFRNLNFKTKTDVLITVKPLTNLKNINLKG